MVITVVSERARLSFRLEGCTRAAAGLEQLLASACRRASAACRLAGATAACTLIQVLHGCYSHFSFSVVWAFPRNIARRKGSVISVVGCCPMTLQYLRVGHGLTNRGPVRNNKGMVLQSARSQLS